MLTLAGASSLAGTLCGGALALAGAGIAAERLPIAPAVSGLAGPLTLSWLFGVLTALTFALPALGRALSIPPAALVSPSVSVDWKLTSFSIPELN